VEIDIDRELDSVERKVERTRAEADAAAARSGPISGTATDGAVTVQVRPGGLPVQVQLSPTALRMPADALAQRIMAVVEKATRKAGDAMYNALAPVLGPDGEKHLTSLGYQPLPPEDEAEAFNSPLGVRPQRGQR
jgi:DNA-binding protein YbaB